MKSNHGKNSLILFGTAIAALLLLTLFESMLLGLSTSAERIISFVLLVVPALIGVVLGILSMVKKESRKWIAITGILLNGLFALFMTFLLSFAG
jgi:hypothetical protein